MGCNICACFLLVFASWCCLCLKCLIMYYNVYIYIYTLPPFCSKSCISKCFKRTWTCCSFLTYDAIEICKNLWITFTSCGLCSSVFFLCLPKNAAVDDPKWRCNPTQWDEGMSLCRVVANLVQGTEFEKLPKYWFDRFLLLLQNLVRLRLATRTACPLYYEMICF